MADEEQPPQNQELLRLEYHECVSHSRFIVGIRFTYFVSFTSFFFILVGAYHYIWASAPEVFGQLKPWLRLVVGLFGFFVLGVAWFIEWRGAQISRTFDRRAAELEKLMGIENGIRQNLADPKQRNRFLGIPVAHTVAISLFYSGIAIVWFLLVVYSGYLLRFSVR